MTPLSERLKLALRLVFPAMRAGETVRMLHNRNEHLRAEHARTAPIVAELLALIPDVEHAMAYYKSCGDQAEPEYQCYAMFAKALARLTAAIEGRG